MKILYKIVLVLTILLSIATGVFKITQQEADIQLFRALGFNEIMTTVLGIVQLAGGVMMIFSKYRKLGALIMIPTFMIASVAVFMNQMWLFGIVSLLFIAMAYMVFRYEHLIKRIA
jgi:hypothetical protein